MQTSNCNEKTSPPETVRESPRKALSGQEAEFALLRCTYPIGGTQTATQRKWTLVLQASPHGKDKFGRDPEYRIRGLLKVALRSFGFRCISVRSEEKAILIRDSK